MNVFHDYMKTIISATISILIFIVILNFNASLLSMDNEIDILYSKVSYIDINTITHVNGTNTPTILIDLNDTKLYADSKYLSSLTNIKDDKISIIGENNTFIESEVYEIEGTKYINAFAFKYLIADEYKLVNKSTQFNTEPSVLAITDRLNHDDVSEKLSEIYDNKFNQGLFRQILIFLLALTIIITLAFFMTEDYIIF